MLSSSVPHLSLTGKTRSLRPLVAAGLLLGVLSASSGKETSSPSPAAGEFFRTEAPAKRESPSKPANSLAPIPARPASRVFDDARVFSPEQSAALSEMLRQSAEQDGLDAYVAATTFVMGETIEVRAQRMADAWCGNSRGLVLVYLRGEKTVTMSTPGGDETFLGKRTLLRAYEKAIRAAKEAESAPERMRITLKELLAGLNVALEEQARMDRVLNPDVVQLLAFFLSALLILTFAGRAIAGVIARIEKRQGTRFYFPQTPVPTRFGAPFGGGVCAEIQFSTARPA